MGIPIIIPTNRTGLKRWLKVVGVILIAVAIYLSATNMHFGKPNFVKEGTVPFSEMNKTDVYEITDAVVFDNYAKYTNDKYEYEYFTILVEDADGNSKYASVVTNVNDAIYADIMAFNKDLSLDYGECVLNGGFTAIKMDDVKMDKETAGKLKGYFNDDLSNCQQVFNAEASDVVFTYACSSEEDFSAYLNRLSEENVDWGTRVAVIAGIGIICIVIGVLMSKKDKKKAMAAAEANAQYFDPNAVYYNPEAENVETAPVQTETEPTQQEYATVASEGYSVLPEKETESSDTEG